MHDLKINLEPGNPDGHSVLRFLVEEKQMPLEMAVERVYKAVAKYAQDYRADQGKLVGAITVTGILGAGIVFPVGIPAVMLLCSVGATVTRWMELGAMRDRLKPEYFALKQSSLLPQFVQWLARELKERYKESLESANFQLDTVTVTNVLSAYEDTIFAVANGEHLDNNASDPILALFLASLRQHTNTLPDWVIQAFRQLEAAEVHRAKDLKQVHQYMWGDSASESLALSPKAPSKTVDVPVQAPVKEGEQGLGKLRGSDAQLEAIAPIESPAALSPGLLAGATSGQLGTEILEGLAVTRRSTLLIGDTGAGKSVTQAYLLIKLFELHPDAEVWVLSQKADSFCGLAEQGRRILFDPTDPESALELIQRIWTIYDKRRRLPESERPNLSPVRLLLCDWLSINQALEDLKSDDVVKASRYLSRLADLIYNGRELNVCLMVDLQSYNLAAVGLKADRNSRKNFNLVGLGNRSVDPKGMVTESYGVLDNLISDHYIVSSESERSALRASLEQLQPLSRQSQQPIIFSGSTPPQLALLPDLRKFKTLKVATKTFVAAESERKTQPEEKVISQAKLVSELNVSAVLADSLGEPLKTIWLYAKKKNGRVTVRDVYSQKFKVLEGKKVEQIRQYFGLLADRGMGEIDEEGKANSSVGFLAR